MKETILVIGATGLLGEPVARKLKEEGYHVRIMVRDMQKAREQFNDEFEKIKGDINDLDLLEKALDGCFGVHINLSGEIETVGVKNICHVSKGLKLDRITYISGTSVSKENIWFPLIRRKFLAEQAIKDSGVPYSIFCPTWFMEIIPRFVRGNRAFVFGKQPNPYHFISADDYARMVAVSYGLDSAINRRFIVHGPEGILFHDAVKKYCEVFHPEIRKVSTMPYWFANFIAFIKRSEEMRFISDFMRAFERIGEMGDPTETNSLLGQPEVTLDQWLKKRKDLGRPE